MMDFLCLWVICHARSPMWQFLVWTLACLLFLAGWAAVEWIRLRLRERRARRWGR